MTNNLAAQSKTFKMNLQQLLKKNIFNSKTYDFHNILKIIPKNLAGLKKAIIVAKLTKCLYLPRIFV
jgi:hypothetical protein